MYGNEIVCLCLTYGYVGRGSEYITEGWGWKHMGYIEDIRKKIGHDLLISVGAAFLYIKMARCFCKSEEIIYAGPCMVAVLRLVKA